MLDQLDEQLALAVAGGGERYPQRHRDRGKLPVRERLELLLDPDSPFLELSALAAWGTEFTVGASRASPASASSPAWSAWSSGTTRPCAAGR